MWLIGVVIWAIVFNLCVYFFGLNEHFFPVLGTVVILGLTEAFTRILFNK